MSKSGFKLPSINEVQSGNFRPIEAAKKEELILPTDAFDDAQFQNEWKRCVSILSEKNLISLNALLLSLSPTPISEFKYEIRVSNKMQAELFNSERGAINDIIRKALNNFSIDFDIQIDQDLSSNRPYTTSEKFKAMAEKNPLMLSLKDKLGLDSEY